MSIFSQWIFKLCIPKYKNHSKASSGTGRFYQNLCACKKSGFNERNCKPGRHNRQHTFMHCKLRHKTTSNNILYSGLKVKDRNKDKTKIPVPCRQN